MKLFGISFSKKEKEVKTESGFVTVEANYWLQGDITSTTLQIPKASFVYHRSSDKWLVINEVIALIKKNTALNFVKLESIKIV